jgi:pyruvate/2-oxoglutarate dehydrogenase complex dihydrolipoamide dehydrogenase (E3) component
MDDLKETVVGIDEKVTRLDAKMDAGFDRVNDRIDKLQHSMIVVGGGLIAAMLAVLAAMLGMVITLLLHHF